MVVDGEKATEQLVNTSGVRISVSTENSVKVDAPDVNLYENVKDCLLGGFLIVAIDK